MTDAAVVTRLLQALVGRSLLQLCVGVGDLQLHFDDGQCVALEGAVRVGDRAAVEPYSLEVLKYVLPLLDGTVTAVSADERGALLLTVDKTTVRCDADSMYEAWNYNGPDGSLVVSTPGGAFASWAGR